MMQKNIKNYEIVNVNIRTSDKKAKKEMNNETDVNNYFGSCEITLGKLQHKITKSSQKMD